MKELLESLKADAQSYAALLAYAVVYGLFLGNPIIGFGMFAFIAAIIWLFKPENSLGMWARLVVVVYGVLYVILAIGLALIRVGVL